MLPCWTPFAMHTRSTADLFETVDKLLSVTTSRAAARFSWMRGRMGGPGRPSGPSSRTRCEVPQALSSQHRGFANGCIFAKMKRIMGEAIESEGCYDHRIE